jgi:hypothetical protein
MKPLDFEHVRTAIGNLHTSEAVHKLFGVPTDTISELTSSGFMPHYKVRGIQEPLFKLSETKEWIGKNLIEHHEGQNLPPSKIFVMNKSELFNPAEKYSSSHSKAICRRHVRTWYGRVSALMEKL